MNEFLENAQAFVKFEQAHKKREPIKDCPFCGTDVAESETYINKVMVKTIEPIELHAKDCPLYEVEVYCTEAEWNQRV